jgi:hypothetical protein
VRGRLAAIPSRPDHGPLDDEQRAFDPVGHYVSFHVSVARRIPARTLRRSGRLSRISLTGSSSSRTRSALLEHSAAIGERHPDAKLNMPGTWPPAGARRRARRRQDGCARRRQEGMNRVHVPPPSGQPPLVSARRRARAVWELSTDRRHERRAGDRLSIIDRRSLVRHLGRARFALVTRRHSRLCQAST